MNLPELIDKLHSDEACREHLERVRWPEGVTCPDCGANTISRIAKRKVYECNKCRRQFSVTSGTIFHDSHLPLRTWFLGIHRISESKKGVSANQLHRELGITYKTAWYMCHRIREAMKQPTAPGLRGIIEVDETYVRGAGVPKGEKLKAGRGSQRTTPLVGAKERGGRVHAKALSALKRDEVWPWLKQAMRIDQVARLYTDSSNIYDHLTGVLPHGRIDHSVAYVWGDIHTNGIESFWALLKRGIAGSYHHVSPKHLQRYVDEYCWRANQASGVTFDALLQVQTQAQPITYRRVTARQMKT